MPGHGASTTNGIVTTTPLTVTSTDPVPGRVLDRMLHVQPQIPSELATRGPSPRVVLCVPDGVT